MLAFDEDGNEVSLAAPKAEKPSRVTQTVNEDLEPEKRALLDTIAGGEAPGYDAMYTGNGSVRRFNDFSDHPRSGDRITSGPNLGKVSRAAGRYQFTPATWDQQAKKLGLPNFRPEHQDLGAADLAESTYGKHMLDALRTGDPKRIASVGRGLNTQWTSLPGGIESSMSDDDFVRSYQKNLAKYKASSQESTPKIGFTDDEVEAVEPVAVPETAPTPAPQAAATPEWSDYAKQYAAGVADIPKTIAAGADLLGADKFANYLREGAKSYEEDWRNQMTPAGREAADKPLLDENNNIQNLRAIPMAAASSIPGMIAMGGAGKAVGSGLKFLGTTEKLAPLIEKIPGINPEVAKKVADWTANGIAYGGAEGVYSGLSNAEQKRDEIINTPLETLAKNPTFQEALRSEPKTGNSIDRAKRVREKLASLAMEDTFLKTAASTGAIGALTGGGIFGQLESRIGKTAAGQIALDTLLESGQEALQSGGESIIGNKVTQKYGDPNRGTFEGTVNDIATGAATGGLLGGVGGAGGVLGGRNEQPISQPSVSGETNGQDANVSNPGNEGREGIPSETQTGRQGGEGRVQGEQESTAPVSPTNATSETQQAPVKVGEKPAAKGYTMLPSPEGIQIVDGDGNVVSTHPQITDAIEAFDQLHADNTQAQTPTDQETSNELQTTTAPSGQVGQLQDQASRGQQASEGTEQGSRQEAVQEGHHGLNLPAQGQANLGDQTSGQLPEGITNADRPTGNAGEDVSGSATSLQSAAGGEQGAGVPPGGNRRGSRSGGAAADVQVSPTEAGSVPSDRVTSRPLTAKEEGELRGHNTVLKKLGKPAMTPEQYLAEQLAKLQTAASNRNVTDQEVVDAYNSAVGRHNQRAVEENRRIDAAGTGESKKILRSNVRAATTLPSSGSLQRRTAESIAKVFGHKVIYVESADGKPLDIDGSIVGSHPNHILLAADSKQSLSRVAIHEMVHGLRRNSPEIYGQLVRNLREHYNPLAVAKHLEDRGYDSELPSFSDNPEVFSDENRSEEEWVSDHVSDIIHHPEAIQQLAERMEGQKVGSGRAFLNHVKDFIDSLISKLRGEGFGTESAVARKHLKKSREAVVEALAKYHAHQQGGGVAKAGDQSVAASSNRGEDKSHAVAQARLENFKQWSNDAPHISSAMAETHQFKTGEKIVVDAFHGTGRPDRVGTRFQKKRATSGPMSYFTSSPALASQYAQNKSDTSLAYEDQAYAQWFKYKPKGQRSSVDIIRSWNFLDGETKNKIRNMAPKVSLDLEDSYDIVVQDDNTRGNGSYDYNLKQSERRSPHSGGNPLEALVEDWLSSGTLFDDEERFMEVLRKVGFPVKDVHYDSPHSHHPFVYKTYIQMQNPLVTSDIPSEVITALQDAAKKDRSKPAAGGADLWDKNTRTLKEWVSNFTDPKNDSAAHVWTSIPDKVTNVFKSLGYDGIVDWSGKGGGSLIAPVYIPFEENQVKSSIGNKGKYSSGKNDILLSNRTTRESYKAKRDARLAREAGDIPASKREPDKAQLQKEFDDTKARYINTPGWLKAPNGKPSRLNEQQWVMVRTPRFKAWFGDFEADLDASAVAINLNGNKFGGNADRAREWLPDHVSGTFTNLASGTKVVISKGILKHKATSGSALSKTDDSEVHLEALRVLPRLIRQAKPVSAEPDNQNDPNILGVQRWVSALTFDEKTYAVKLTIKDHADQKPGENRRFYVHELINFEVATVSTSLQGVTRLKPKQTADGARRVQPLKITIRDLVSAINTKEPGAIPKVSKIIDQNGEPLVVYHGSEKAGFTVFDTNGKGKTAGAGAFFTASNMGAFTYSGTQSDAEFFDSEDGEQFDPDYHGSRGNYAVFLNIKDPSEIDAGGRSWDSVGSEDEWYTLNEDGDVLEYFTNEEDANHFRDTSDEYVEIEKSVNNETGASTDDLAKEAKDQGYDGVIFKNIMDEGPHGQGYGWDDTVYVAFSPNQIKSADRNTGEYSEAKNDIRFSNRTPNPPFYSQLARGFASSKMDSMPGSQWRVWLFSNKAKLGIKDDEIAWTGIEDFLRLKGKERVTKSDIASFLKDNGVQVSEVVRSKDATRWNGNTLYIKGKKVGSIQEDDKGYVFVDMDGETKSLADSVSMFGAVNDVERMFGVEGAANRDSTPKYEQYTLPGGTNYRELLITLPSSETSRRSKLDAVNDKVDALLNGRPVADLTNDEREKYAQLVRQHDSIADLPRGDDYRSSHWDEPNVLVHIRVNDREDTGGNKVLFVQEIQSDFGQEGRKKGFKAKVQKPFTQWMREDKGIKDEGLIEFEEQHPHQSENFDEWAALQDGVSPAPFVTETKSWVSLALKRIIRMAAEGGYDKVAFVNGEQSADLYDLSKQVDSLLYKKNDDGTYQVSAVTQGRGNLLGESLTESELEDHVGKEIAQKIVDGEGRRTEVQGKYDPASMTSSKDYMNELSGVDLKVGGEGMKAFYDQIVPQIANEVLKKVGGGRVGVVDFGKKGSQNKLGNTYQNARIRHRSTNPDVFQVWAQNENGAEVLVSENLSTQEEATKFMADMESRMSQPGFDVTPAMRDKALDGMPLFSNRKNILGETPLATWTSPKSTPIDNIIYTMQDKLVDTKRVQEAISSAQRLIADEWNPYQKELLYHGRTAKQTDDFLSQEIRPLFTAMEDQGISMDELEEYLHNRHAEERNEQIAKINPGMSDGGSGIKTQDARDYLRMLPPDKAEKLEHLAAQVDAISKGTRELLVKTGLETQATVDAWQGAYKHYVPLQREELEVSPKGQGTGQGMSIRGSSSKRATGSTRKVVDILANLMMQRERAIVRSEKNKVATALYGLAIQNENPSFWLPVNPDAIKNPDQVVQELLNMGLDQADIDGIMAEPTETVVDSKTGLVVHRINPRLRSMDNVLATRINGKDRFLFFSKEDERAVRMVAALKNLDEDRLGTILTNFRKVTRWMSAINTQYNPIFGIVNLARDVQGGMLNLTSTPLAGKQLAVLSNVGPALKGIYSDLRADRKGKPRSSNAWSTLWEEYQGAGGRTGYRDAYKDSADRAEALRKEIKRIQEGTLKRFGRGIFDWLSDYNDTLENAIRLSAYKVAKDQGISKDQAAALAKNLTVNFNKKGQIASQAGSLYAFFNAGIQGNFRLAQTLSGSAGKKILAGGLILGSAQAILLAAAGYDDDEPPEFTRERNLIIPVGGSKYVTIPLPLGFHVIPNTSRILTELVLNKGKDSGDKLISLLASYADAFDPMGFSGFSYQTLSPTAADPLVALAENRNSFGREIAKEDRSSLDPSPGFTRMKDTATGFSKIAAYVINRMSGGTDYKPGHFSPTPDQIDYLIGQATGGVGREVQKTAQFVSSTISGEDIPPHKIPLAGRFYGDTKSQSSETARFYKNLKELNAHEREIKGRIKDGKDVKAYEAEHPEAAMVSAANAVEKMLTDLKTRKRIMIARGASRSEVKALEGEIASRIKKFNDDVKARSQK